jgi:hypothetical protein
VITETFGSHVRSRAAGAGQTPDPAPRKGRVAAWPRSKSPMADHVDSLLSDCEAWCCMLAWAGPQNLGIGLNLEVL